MTTAEERDLRKTIDHLQDTIANAKAEGDIETAMWRAEALARCQEILKQKKENTCNAGNS